MSHIITNYRWWQISYNPKSWGIKITKEIDWKMISKRLAMYVWVEQHIDEIEDFYKDESLSWPVVW